MRRSDDNLRILIAVFAFVALVVIGCADFGTGIIPPADDGGGGNTDTIVVSFAAQILPIFQTNCTGNACHIPCRTLNGGGLCLVSHATLLARGVLTPGDSANSLIVKYLEGRVSPRMPFGRLPLPDSTIMLIRSWIAQGALDN